MGKPVGSPPRPLTHRHRQRADGEQHRHRAQNGGVEPR